MKTVIISVFFGIFLNVFSQEKNIPNNWLSKKNETRIFDNNSMKFIRGDTLNRIFHAFLESNANKTEQLFYFSDTSKVELFYIGTCFLEGDHRAGIIYSKSYTDCDSSETVYYSSINENKFDELRVLFNKSNDCFFDYQYCSVLYNQGLMAFNITTGKTEFSPHRSRIYTERDSIVDLGDTLSKLLIPRKNYNFLSVLKPIEYISTLSIKDSIFNVPLNYIYNNDIYEKKKDEFTRKKNINFDQKFYGTTKHGWMITSFGKNQNQDFYCIKVKGNRIKLKKLSSYGSKIR